MNILITICGRGGSKGVPGKNLSMLGEKHLISYSIDMANRFAKKTEELYGAKVVIELSTDSLELKELAKRYSLETTYTRDASLAQDDSGKVAVLLDIYSYAQKERNVQFDFLLDLDIASPLRTLFDLEEAFKMLLANSNALNLFSVSPAEHNPYFCIVEEKDNSFFSLVKESKSLSRQKAPTVYDMNGSFYFYTKEFLDRGFLGAITERSLVYLVPHICFDIDSLLDLEYMNYLILNNKLDFEFS